MTQIESARIRADLGNAAAAEVVDLREPSPASPADAAPSATPDAPSSVMANRGKAETAPTLPLDQLCNALITSAQDNDLPVAFFANLIWQESRLRDDAVSPKGALGIAQFMPRVAVEAGLINPFDPLQALPASARLLADLRDQFGNLGFVAAAYNAGAKRVSEWLQRGRTLPRETRGYVLNITGRSVEQWQKAPPADVDLRFSRRLPCRDLPAFAQLERAQLQQAESEPDLGQAQHAQTEEMPSQRQQPGPNARAAKRARAAAHPKRERMADGQHGHGRSSHESLRTTERARYRSRHEAKDRTHTVTHGRHIRA